MKNILNRLLKIMGLPREKSKIVKKGNIEKHSPTNLEIKVQKKKEPIISVKTKTFIYKLGYIFLYPFKQIQGIHHRIKAINLKEIDENLENTPFNPYQCVFLWLLEIVEYGLLMSLPINAFFGWQGWKNFLWIPTLGILRYLWYDTLEETRKIIKEGKREIK